MDDTCRIRVVCRVRPLNAKEQANSSFVLRFPTNSTIDLAVSQLASRTEL